MTTGSGERSAITGRVTRQKKAILAGLESSTDFLTAQELHGLLRERGDSVSLATVYRVLQQMVAAGEVDILPQDDGEALFRQCASTGHHHHLVCRRCGATVEIEAPTVERWASRVAEEHGYTEVEHTLEIYGLCPACASLPEGSSN